jgi:hypothetical protein
MIYQMIAEFHVPELRDGVKWYSSLLNRKPDFLQDGRFAEWSVASSCCFRLSPGLPKSAGGPLHFGVNSLEAELKRLKKANGIQVDHTQIHTEHNLQIRWCTLEDPWTNRFRLFEYWNETHKSEVIKSIQEDWNAAGPA